MKCIEVNAESIGHVQDAIAGDVPVLMLYKMRHCPHCIALEPAWADVKAKLGPSKGVRLAEVEFHKMELLHPKFRNIRGFPTIHLLQNGKLQGEYSGDRTSKSIVDFVKANSAPAPPAAKKKAAPAKKAAPKPSKKPKTV